MCYMYHEMNLTQNLSMELSANFNTAVVMALPEVKSCACVALKKLLLLVSPYFLWLENLELQCSLTKAYSTSQIIELDSSRNSADLQGFTNRADGVRYFLLLIFLCNCCL